MSDTDEGDTGYVDGGSPHDGRDRRERMQKEIDAAKVVKEKIKRARNRFDPQSPEARQGAQGEERALRLITEALADSSVHIRRGSSNPRANGMMGDITLSPSPVDAPLVGVEVKAPGREHPNSFCLSRFEFESSLADWVMVLNEDEEAGVWIVTMQEARGHARDMGEYVVCSPPLRSRVKFSNFIQRLSETAKGWDQR